MSPSSPIEAIILHQFGHFYYSKAERLSNRNAVLKIPVITN